MGGHLMPDSITVNVKGLSELASALKQLPQMLAGKALGASVAAGGKIIRDQAIENARRIFKVPTGATEKSIVLYREKDSTPDNITYQVGITHAKTVAHASRKSCFWGYGKNRKINHFGGLE